MFALTTSTFAAPARVALRAKAAKSARRAVVKTRAEGESSETPTTVADAVTAADAEWTEKAETPAPAAFSAAIDPADGSVAGSMAAENACLLYTSPSPRDVEESRMPSSA